MVSVVLACDVMSRGACASEARKSQKSTEIMGRGSRIARVAGRESRGSQAADPMGHGSLAVAQLKRPALSARFYALGGFFNKSIPVSPSRPPKLADPWKPETRTKIAHDRMIYGVTG